MDHSRTLEVCNRAIGWSGSIREASCRNCRGGEIAIKPIKAGRRAVSRGAAPRYELEVEARRIKEFPRLEFDGSNPAIVEAGPTEHRPPSYELGRKGWKLRRPRF